MGGYEQLHEMLSAPMAAFICAFELKSFHPKRSEDSESTLSGYFGGLITEGKF